MCFNKCKRELAADRRADAAREREEEEERRRKRQKREETDYDEAFLRSFVDEIVEEVRNEFDHSIIGDSISGVQAERLDGIARFFSRVPQ